MADGMAALSGVRVIVAGAGLAGLTAAYELGRRGAHVLVFEARDRLGGRLWTMRDHDAETHVEAGGEFIDGEQTEIRALAASLRVGLVRVLRRGLGVALNVDGKRQISANQQRAWRSLIRPLRPAVAAFKAAGCDWNTPSASAIAGYSFAGALKTARASRQNVAMSE